MALKQYYDLSAMLRMQLPVLLLFAVLRYLMGTVVRFWARKFVPVLLQRRVEPVWDATARLLSAIHCCILASSIFYAAQFYSEWSMKTAAIVTAGRDVPLLACSEFSNTRVQGLVCASGLLALFTSGDAMALGFALATLKCVADGSAYGMVMAATTWRACMGMHHSNPKVFYALIFLLNAPFAVSCYKETHTANVSGGSILAMSFAALSLGARALIASFTRTWRLWVRIRTVVWTPAKHLLAIVCRKGRRRPD